MPIHLRAFVALFVCTLVACAAGSSAQWPPPVKSPATTMGSVVHVRFAVKIAPSSATEYFTVAVHPEWAPLGAARFLELVHDKFYDNSRFFRVIKHFMAQFGLAASPEVNAFWQSKVIADDPSVKGISNKAGFISFATAGPNTRTTQIFINFKNNSRLDAQGFVPFAQVVGNGMAVVNRIYHGYGEAKPAGHGPPQSKVETRGAHYLAEHYPKLTVIESVTVVGTAHA
jgi:peptidyl-prolyl cis-trans isomerase A (cyclophilin A)